MKYADNIVLLDRTLEDPQCLFGNMNTFCNTYSIEINTKKTKDIIADYN